MARLRYLKQTSIRALFSPLNKTNTFFNNYSTTAPSTSNAVLINPLFSSYSPARRLQVEDVVGTFQNWYKSSQNPSFEQILEILSSKDLLSQRESADVALSRLNIKLTESLVLDVLSYGKDVLSCLKFFDWAGRQPGFNHTRATFNSIFKILSRSKLMSLMLDYLDNYSKHRGHRTSFNAILVMGYAVAGKSEIALELFGRMRYQGIDLDDFSYHVLLNALVEEGDFGGVESIARQIKIRGFESVVTYTIMVKYFCKKKEFDKAETYLREVMNNNGDKIKSKGRMVGSLVDGLCKNNEFRKAKKLVNEFGEYYVYDVWVRELLRAQKLNEAMEFISCRNRESDIVYIPDVFRFNTLITRLLRTNRLEDVCDLVIEMRENNVFPDELTMNILLCFFCKAGMADVALSFYDSSGEIGLSPSHKAFNELINTLCGEGNVVDAFRVFKNLINQGYFPGKESFFILANALCKLEKLDLMNELFLMALEKNVVFTNTIHENYISALCRTGRVEEAYFIHNNFNKVTTKPAYENMINAFIKLKRGDIATELLIEMQNKGFNASRLLLTSVIQCVCEMENPEIQFQHLLEMQLSLHNHNLHHGVFNVFIQATGVAKKADLATQVYQMMKRSGIKPRMTSDILLLESYLTSEKVSDAIYFFNDIFKRRKLGRKVTYTLVTGLCKANKPDLALAMFYEIRTNKKKVRPTLECYEELIYLLCMHKRYDKVVDLIDDLYKVGRPLSSFIGNNLLLHSLKHRELYNTWVNSRSPDEMSPVSRLGELIGYFTEPIRDDVDLDDLEKLVGDCFPLDIFTYNLLLRKLSMKQIDEASRLFQKICEKGLEPNQWTYEAMVHGFCKRGRITDAKMWLEKMLRKGFVPSEATKVLL